jgi:hypothetical protein
MPAPSTRSPDADDRFFTALENGHSVNTACAAAGYARRCVYRWRSSDRMFAARWRDANAVACDLLADEADRRGRDGFDVPVFYKGEQCGAKRRYSDSLLLARLKALRPEQYRETPTLISFGQPLRAPPRDIELEQVIWDMAHGKKVDFTKVSPHINALFDAVRPAPELTHTPDPCATCATSDTAPLVENPENAGANDSLAAAPKSL